MVVMKLHNTFVLNIKRKNILAKNAIYVLVNPVILYLYMLIQRVVIVVAENVR